MFSACLALTVDFLLQKAEAMQLVRDGIAAGVFNDLGSGTNIDLCIITDGNVEYLRPYDEPNPKGERWVHGCLKSFGLIFKSPLNC